MRQVLAGELVERRTLLRAAACAALGVPVLAACGTTFRLGGNRGTYGIDLVGGYLPQADLERLISARAHALGVFPTLMPPGTPSTGSTDLSAELRLQTALGPYDPTSNSSPPTNSLLVVGATNDSSAVEPIAAAAIKHGVKIVSFPTPLQHQTSAILVNAARGAAMLTMHAATWSRVRLQDRAKVLLVLPSEADSSPYNAAGGTSSEQAFAQALPRYAPGLSVVATTRALGDSLGGYLAATKAIAAHPEIQMALVWNDDAATGVVRALRRNHPHGALGGLYVGALGAPVVYSAGTLRELEQDDLLRVVIAPRLRDLANAMVDLPHALLRNARPESLQLALQTLTPRSPVLTEYSRDYPRHATGDYPNGYLNGVPQ